MLACSKHKENLITKRCQLSKKSLIRQHKVKNNLWLAKKCLTHQISKEESAQLNFDYKISKMKLIAALLMGAVHSAEQI